MPSASRCATVKDRSFQGTRLIIQGFFRQLAAEVRQRRVLKVVVAYAVSAWLVLQVAEVTFEPLGLPDWSMRLLVVIAICGFPLSFLLAWVIDIRPDGLIFDRPLWRGANGDSRPESRADLLTGMLLLAVTGAMIYALLLALVEEPVAQPAVVPVAIEAGPPEGSIAVLAFDTFDNVQESEYFASGLAEEILNLLAAIPELNVTARTSSFRFRGEQVDIREVAELLNVRHVLEGSVRRKGDRIRVTAQLIDGLEGYHDWSKTYDRNLVDVFAIQQEIAAAVVNELRLTLSVDSAERLQEQPTQDINAYMFYLQGRERLYRSVDADVMRTARQLFRQALAIDPDFARAWAGICEVELRLYEISNNTSRFGDAEAACQQASSLNPGLQYEVGIALGKLYRYRGWYDQAEEHVRRVIQASPTEADAYIELGEILVLQGRDTEAEANLLKAVDLKRSYWKAWEALASLYYTTDRYAESVRAYETLTQLTPDVATGFAGLGAAYWLLGDTSRALQAYQRSIELKPSRQAYTNIGLLQYYRGEFEISAEMQRKALEFAPKDHRVWGRLAESYRFMTGKEKAAREAYAKAAELASSNLEINPEDWITRASLGLYRIHLGERNEGKALVLEAVEGSNGAPEILYFQALAEVASDDPDAAISALQAAMAVDTSYRMFIETDPDLAVLRSDSRYASLVDSPVTTTP